MAPPFLATPSITSYLAAKVLSGELERQGEPELMTRVFINVTIDGLLYRKLLGVARPLTVEAQNDQIRRAVDIVMRLYAPAAPQKTSS